MLQKCPDKFQPFDLIYHLKLPAPAPIPPEEIELPGFYPLLGVKEISPRPFYDHLLI